MEKINLRILFFLSLLASLFKSDDYNYDDYDEYNYDRNYDYNNQESEDYTDDYNQESNDYYGNQNLLAPAPPPPFIPEDPYCFRFNRTCTNNEPTNWCKSLFPTTPKIYGTALYKVT